MYFGVLHIYINRCSQPCKMNTNLCSLLLGKFQWCPDLISQLPLCVECCIADNAIRIRMQRRIQQSFIAIMGDHRIMKRAREIVRRKTNDSIWAPDIHTRHEASVFPPIIICVLHIFRGIAKERTCESVHKSPDVDQVLISISNQHR